MATEAGPLYLGFDLSTQQLKAIVVDSDLRVRHEAKVDFDADLSKYGIKKGVINRPSTGEVVAPVAMWLEAVDLVLQRLQDRDTPFECIRGLSGAGQQHGSVYWNATGERLLGTLHHEKTIVEQLSPDGLAYPWSPNWQDASTQTECDAFDQILGSEDELARVTGSKAHHRFTGPQIMRLQRLSPAVYRDTTRISLVSSFLASVFLGKVAPIDISDVCGGNLWDIRSGSWHTDLLHLSSGFAGKDDLRKKLGKVPEDGGACLGSISDYFVKRFGFSKDCQVIPFTGDNPSTILALPLRPLDAIVSLGTSTTFLMSTPTYHPDPAYHFFNHPTTAGLYMFMLCYKNGGLARETIRDQLQCPQASNLWAAFDTTVLSSPILGQHSSSDPSKLGLFFPLPEIVPNVRAGTWRYNLKDGKLSEARDWDLPTDDARAIVESQVLSLRYRSKSLVSPTDNMPAQPRRVYLVGGGSHNKAIAKVVGDVLGGVEGVYKLDVGSNACALGSAYKAVWAMERQGRETFEDLIGKRWRENESVERIGEGFEKDTWHRYGSILEAFGEMERRVIAGEKHPERGTS